MNSFRGMQPTLPPQSTGAADDMDSLPAVQSMDWLFKKERIYLLAQFWQQVSDFHYQSAGEFRHTKGSRSCKTKKIIFSTQFDTAKCRHFVSREVIKSPKTNFRRLARKHEA